MRCCCWVPVLALLLLLGCLGAESQTPPPPPCPAGYCSGHGQCDNSGGSPECSCAAGWAPPRCRDCANPCTTAAPPAQHATWSSCQDGKCLGDKCTAVCATGYDASGSGRYTCSEDGSWSGGALTCTPKSCRAGPIPGVAHATSCPAGKYGSAPCSIECEPGYQGSGSGRYTCDATGQWSGGNLRCDGKACIGAPTAGGDLHVAENADVPGHFPSTLTFSCAGSNERVAGDTVWECSNKTLSYEPVTVPGARAQDVKCTTCPQLASGHCPPAELRCPVHFEPSGCCKSWCMWWDTPCRPVVDKTCHQCEPGYADGSPAACNAQQCPDIPVSDGMKSVAYKVDGKPVQSAPKFSGSATLPTALAEFQCEQDYILTTSASDFVAKDTDHSTWACGVSSDGKTPEWKAWNGHGFVAGIDGLPRCMATCPAKPCSSAATPEVGATAHFSKCYDNGGKQKFRCTCKTGWQGERCDTDIDECAHTRYSENCLGACEELLECPVSAQGRLPATCSPTGFALESGSCDAPYWVDKDDPSLPSGCDRDSDRLLTACHNVNGSWSCGACLEQPSCCKDSPANIRATGPTPWHESSNYVVCDAQSTGNSGACPNVKWEQPGCTGLASADESSATLALSSDCDLSPSECTCHTNPLGDHREVYNTGGRGVTHCGLVGSKMTIAIDPEDDHRRKTGNNNLTLFRLFNVTFYHISVSGTAGLRPCGSEAVRQAISWQPDAKTMNDRQGEYTGTFACTTAALYQLGVQIGGNPLAQGGVYHVLVVPAAAFINNTLAQLVDSPGWCVQSDRDPRCRTMPSRSNKISVRVRDQYGNERRRVSLQDGPAGDKVTWETQAVAGRLCEECGFNSSKPAAWEGDVDHGAYTVEFAFDAKIEHEFVVVMKLNGQPWGAIFQEDMQPSDQALTPALPGVVHFRYALHTNLDPRACAELNCSNFLNQRGHFNATDCRNAGCTFEAGTPAVPNRVQLMLDWDRALLGNINVTVVRDACNGPAPDPRTGHRKSQKDYYYWEQPSYCVGINANGTDVIECGPPQTRCVNQPPLWDASNTTGTVEIQVNHPGLYIVNVETTLKLPGGGVHILRLPTRQLSVGPGSVDNAMSLVHAASIEHNLSTSGNRKLGQYDLSNPGEGYNFSFAVRDSEQNARIGKDELVVEITRVDPRVLRNDPDPDTQASADYQPDVAHHPFNITYITVGLLENLPKRESDSVFVESMPYGDKNTGIYKFNQSLFEFGVFSVKAWVCTKETRANCLNHETALANSYTFTVCPQNTDVDNVFVRRDVGLNGTLTGAWLQSCQCQAGFTSPSGHGENCNACERGKYQSDMRQKDCNDCAAGTYCGCSSEWASVDSEMCAESAWNPACAQCEACPPGKFQNREGQGSCRQCREGFDCSDASMTFPIALKGHWVNPRDPREYYECVPAEACPGTSLWDKDRDQVLPRSKIKGWQKKCTAEYHPYGFDESDPCFEVVGSKCKLGYTSGVFGGSKCENCCRKSNYQHGIHSSCDGDMWRRTNGKCVPCEHKSNALLAGFVIIMALFVGPAGKRVCVLAFLCDTLLR